MPVPKKEPSWVAPFIAALGVCGVRLPRSAVPMRLL